MTGVEYRTVLAAGVVVGAVGAAVAHYRASDRWAADSEEVRDQLLAANVVREANYCAREIVNLPAPVQRYFRAVLTDGQPVVTHARIASKGTFNMGEPAAPAWKPFTAVQDFYPGAPGFVWDARVRMLPGVDAYVRDSFAGGAGSMHASVAGLVTVADSHGSPEIAAGALMRYLAEAPWFPTALLPGQGVTWAAAAEQRATATLRAGATSVSADFEFGPDGLIARCIALRDNDKLHAKLPWGGRYSAWIERDGMKIPGAAEVAWELPAGTFPYWRGTVEPVYDFTIE